jgi:hypothetical protein
VSIWHSALGKKKKKKKKAMTAQMINFFNISWTKKQVPMKCTNLSDYTEKKDWTN